MATTAIEQTSKVPSKKQRQRKPIVRWKGVLADSERAARLMVAALLAVGSAALTFTQLGFVGVGFEGYYVGYIVVLLEPVALGALLLGTLPGTALGLFAGAVLYLHAKAMPLDYYELSFVTPVTSIIMLTIAGFLLGALFAFALRNNPHGIKRFAYIFIVCAAVSTLYSALFEASVIAQLVIDMIEDYPAVSAGEMNDLNEVSDELMSELKSKAIRISLRVGSVDLQCILDALLMTVSCAIGDAIARLAISRRGSMGLRGVFGTWLSAVVLLAFMITSATSFVTISRDEYNNATKSMDGEVTYLCNQLNATSNHIHSLTSFLNQSGLDESQVTEENMSDLLDAVSMDSLLTGYSREEDGFIIVSSDLLLLGEAEDEPRLVKDSVVLSDDESLPSGLPLSDVFDQEALDAIEESRQTGEVKRIIFDSFDFSLIGEGSSAEQISELKNTASRSELAYVLARDADDYSVTMIMPSTMVFADRDVVMLWTTLSFLVLLLAVFGLTFRLLNRTVARRIDETNDALARVAAGDLDARVDVHDTREFDSLSTGINDTVSALKGWIAEAETRMDAELATAKAIQEAALPRIFPPYPDILRFDVYATMNAAREVGGDFYDFFLIGDESGPDVGKLGFVIADVSGKGVPAALFMMKAKTQIRDYLASGMHPGEAVENANRQLCDGNDEGMFVTVWAGVLDYAANSIEFVNAGHNPPLIWQSGSWHWVKEKSGLPLGLFDGMPYKTHALECQIGDQLLLYTDGITEAMSADGELYGEQRLESIAQTNYPAHPRELIDAVRRDVAAYTIGAEQSDDITLLSLEVGVPPEITATLVVPASTDELPRVNEFIHTELDRRLCPLRAQKQLDIAVEELFVNVAHYAYPDATPEKPGTVRVSYTYSAEPPSITVDIADEGVPYDPLAKPDAVTPDDIMDVPIGGLGILMAKKSVDDMRYARLDGSNIVTIVKRW